MVEIITPALWMVKLFGISIQTINPTTKGTHMSQKTNNLRFCMMYTHYSKDKANAGEIKRMGSAHPQKTMEELGITYERAIPQSIADQWWFLNCANVPKDLPPFLKDLGFEPSSP
jgi:hypothetical protein